MSQDRSTNNDNKPQADDSFWDSLFRLEESFQSPPVDIEPTPEETQPNIEEKYHEPRDIVSNHEPPGTFSGDPWKLAEAFFAADQVLRLPVSGYNKGGLLVLWNGIQGFVPASQLIDLPQFHMPRERLRALENLQNRELNLKIIEVNQAKSRLIFSERATLVAAEAREHLLHGVKPGDKRTGVVTNLTQFGVFVDLGGVEGLIHISEISWSRVTHPSMVLKPGQEVEVLVLSVDPDSERVALSMKQLRPDPWATAEERYRPNQLVHGVIGNITTYGAFVVLEEELEGLVHVSELAEGVFLHPRDVVHTGEAVVARVLSVDSRQKRIALTMLGIGRGASAAQE